MLIGLVFFDVSDSQIFWRVLFSYFSFFTILSGYRLFKAFRKSGMLSSFQDRLGAFSVGSILLAVAGVFVLRRRKSEHNFYKMWGYPFTPAIYLLLMGWSLSYVTILRPEEALFGSALVLLGFLVYFLLNSKDSEN